MKFHSKIVSPAYSYADGKVVLPVRGKGTNWQLGIRQWTHPEVQFKDSVGKSTPYITLVPQAGNIHAVSTEGVPLVFTVKLREAAATDISGTWTLRTEEDGLLVENILEETMQGMGSGALNTEDTFSQQDRFSILADADVADKTGTYTVLAGELTTQISVTTADDLLFTGGANTYKYTTITLTSDDGLNIQESGVGLLMDNHVPVLYDGAINVLAKRDELLPEETVLNSLTSAPLQLLIGEGFESYGIEGTSIHEFLFEPELGSFILTDDAIDLNGQNLYYQIILHIAE